MRTLRSVFWDKRFKKWLWIQLTADSLAFFKIILFQVFSSKNIPMTVESLNGSTMEGAIKQVKQVVNKVVSHTANK